MLAQTELDVRRGWPDVVAAGYASVPVRTVANAGDANEITPQRGNDEPRRRWGGKVEDAFSVPSGQDKVSAAPPMCLDPDPFQAFFEATLVRCLTGSHCGDADSDVHRSREGGGDGSFSNGGRSGQRATAELASRISAALTNACTNEDTGAVCSGELAPLLHHLSSGAYPAPRGTADTDRMGRAAQNPVGLSLEAEHGELSRMMSAAAVASASPSAVQDVAWDEVEQLLGRAEELFFPVFRTLGAKPCTLHPQTGAVAGMLPASSAFIWKSPSPPPPGSTMHGAVEQEGRDQPRRVHVQFLLFAEQLFASLPHFPPSLFSGVDPRGRIDHHGPPPWQRMFWNCWAHAPLDVRQRCPVGELWCVVTLRRFVVLMLLWRKGPLGVLVAFAQAHSTQLSPPPTSHQQQHQQQQLGNAEHLPLVTPNGESSGGYDDIAGSAMTAGQSSAAFGSYVSPSAMGGIHGAGSNSPVVKTTSLRSMTASETDAGREVEALCASRGSAPAPLLVQQPRPQYAMMMPKTSGREGSSSQHSPPVEDKGTTTDASHALTEHVGGGMLQRRQQQQQQQQEPLRQPPQGVAHLRATPPTVPRCASASALSASSPHPYGDGGGDRSSAFHPPPPSAPPTVLPSPPPLARLDNYLSTLAPRNTGAASSNNSASHGLHPRTTNHIGHAAAGVFTSLAHRAGLTRGSPISPRSPSLSSSLAPPHIGQHHAANLKQQPQYPQKQHLLHSPVSAAQLRRGMFFSSPVSSTTNAPTATSTVAQPSEGSGGSSSIEQSFRRTHSNSYGPVATSLPSAAVAMLTLTRAGPSGRDSTPHRHRPGNNFARNDSRKSQAHSGFSRQSSARPLASSLPMANSAMTTMTTHTYNIPVPPPPPPSSSFRRSASYRRPSTAGLLHSSSSSAIVSRQSPSTATATTATALSTGLLVLVQNHPYYALEETQRPREEEGRSRRRHRGSNSKSSTRRHRHHHSPPPHAATPAVNDRKYKNGRATAETPSLSVEALMPNPDGFFEQWHRMKTTAPPSAPPVERDGWTDASSSTQNAVPEPHPSQPRAPAILVAPLEEEGLGMHRLPTHAWPPPSQRHQLHHLQQHQTSEPPPILTYHRKTLTAETELGEDIATPWSPQARSGYSVSVSDRVDGAGNSSSTAASGAGGAAVAPADDSSSPSFPAHQWRGGRGGGGAQASEVPMPLTSAAMHSSMSMPPSGPPPPILPPPPSRTALPGAARPRGPLGETGPPHSAASGTAPPPGRSPPAPSIDVLTAQPPPPMYPPPTPSAPPQRQSTWGPEEASERTARLLHTQQLHSAASNLTNSSSSTYHAAPPPTRQQQAPPPPQQSYSQSTNSSPNRMMSDHPLGSPSTDGASFRSADDVPPQAQGKLAAQHPQPHHGLLGSFVPQPPTSSRSGHADNASLRSASFAAASGPAGRGAALAQSGSLRSRPHSGSGRRPTGAERPSATSVLASRAALENSTLNELSNSYKGHAVVPRALQTGGKLVKALFAAAAAIVQAVGRGYAARRYVAFLQGYRRAHQQRAVDRDRDDAQRVLVEPSLQPSPPPTTTRESARPPPLACFSPLVSHGKERRPRTSNGTAADGAGHVEDSGGGVGVVAQLYGDDALASPMAGTTTYHSVDGNRLHRRPSSSTFATAQDAARPTGDVSRRSSASQNVPGSSDSFSGNLSWRGGGAERDARGEASVSDKEKTGLFPAGNQSCTARFPSPHSPRAAADAADRDDTAEGQQAASRLKTAAFTQPPQTMGEEGGRRSVPFPLRPPGPSSLVSPEDSILLQAHHHHRQHSYGSGNMSKIRQSGSPKVTLNGDVAGAPHPPGPSARLPLPKLTDLNSESSLSMHAEAVAAMETSRTQREVAHLNTHSRTAESSATGDDGMHQQQQQQRRRQHHAVSSPEPSGHDFPPHNSTVTAPFYSDDAAASDKGEGGGGRVAERDSGRLPSPLQSSSKQWLLPPPSLQPGNPLSHPSHALSNSDSPLDRFFKKKKTSGEEKSSEPGDARGDSSAIGSGVDMSATALPRNGLSAATVVTANAPPAFAQQGQPRSPAAVVAVVPSSSSTPVPEYGGGTEDMESVDGFAVAEGRVDNPEAAVRCAAQLLLRVWRGFTSRCELGEAWRVKQEEDDLDRQLRRMMAQRPLPRPGHTAASLSQTPSSLSTSPSAAAAASASTMHRPPLHTAGPSPAFPLTPGVPSRRERDPEALFSGGNGNPHHEDASVSTSRECTPRLLSAGSEDEDEDEAPPLALDLAQIAALTWREMVPSPGLLPSAPLSFPAETAGDAFSGAAAPASRHHATNSFLTSPSRSGLSTSIPEGGAGVDGASLFHGSPVALPSGGGGDGGSSGSGGAGGHSPSLSVASHNAALAEAHPPRAPQPHQPHARNQSGGTAERLASPSQRVSFLSFDGAKTSPRVAAAAAAAASPHPPSPFGTRPLTHRTPKTAGQRHFPSTPTTGPRKPAGVPSFDSTATLTSATTNTVDGGSGARAGFTGDAAELERLAKDNAKISGRQARQHSPPPRAFLGHPVDFSNEGEEKDERERDGAAALPPHVISAAERMCATPSISSLPLSADPTDADRDAAEAGTAQQQRRGPPSSLRAEVHTPVSHNTPPHTPHSMQDGMPLVSSPSGAQAAPEIGRVASTKSGGGGGAGRSSAAAGALLTPTEGDSMFPSMRSFSANSSMPFSFSNTTRSLGLDATASRSDFYLSTRRRSDPTTAALVEDRVNGDQADANGEGEGGVDARGSSPGTVGRTLSEGGSVSPEPWVLNGVECETSVATEGEGSSRNGSGSDSDNHSDDEDDRDSEGGGDSEAEERAAFEDDMRKAADGVGKHFFAARARLLRGAADEDRRRLNTEEAVRLLQRTGRGYLCRRHQHFRFLVSVSWPEINLMKRVVLGYVARKRLGYLHHATSIAMKEMAYWELRNRSAITLQRLARGFVARQRVRQLQRKLKARLELRIAVEEPDDDAGY